LNYGFLPDFGDFESLGIAFSPNHTVTTKTSNLTMEQLPESTQGMQFLPHTLQYTLEELISRKERLELTSRTGTVTSREKQGQYSPVVAFVGMAMDISQSSSQDNRNHQGKGKGKSQSKGVKGKGKGSGKGKGHLLAGAHWGAKTLRN